MPLRFAAALFADARCFDAMLADADIAAAMLLPLR